MNAPELTIAIPTRNEAEPLPSLIDQLRAVMDPLAVSYEILVVDGRSTDDTRAVAADRGCRVVLQPRRGLGDAVRHAFREARAPFVVTMDADHSHPPELIRSLLARRRDADLILASRYVEGGVSEDVPMRRLLSRFLNRVYCVVLGLPYHDISTGYRLYRKAALDALRLDTLEYDIQEEIVFRMHRAGAAIIEIPLHFVARKAGDSKARILRLGFHFAVTLRRLWRERARGRLPS